MRAACLECSFSFPLQQHVVGGLFEGSLDEGVVVVLVDDLGLMTLRLGPVVGIVGMLTGGVGET